MLRTLHRHPLIPYRISFAETVKVIVGSPGGSRSKQEFTVYLDIFANRSAFFREYQRCTEDKSKPLLLQGYRPGTFDMYLHCLYNNEVPECVQTPGDDKVAASAVYRADWKFRILINLYTLAIELFDPITVNMVIDKIRELGQKDHTPGREAIELACAKNLKDGDKLRSLFADFYIFDKNATYSESDQNYPRAFLDLVVKRFLRWRNSGDIGVKSSLLKTVSEDRQWASDEYH
jgi:hypothetical protein